MSAIPALENAALIFSNWSYIRFVAVRDRVEAVAPTRVGNCQCTVANIPSRDRSKESRNSSAKTLHSSQLAIQFIWTAPAEKARGQPPF